MQQMMEGTRGSSAPAWWSLSASMALPQPSNSEMWQRDHDHGGQDLPESWCQLLLGGFIGEEDQKHGLIKRTESGNFGVEPVLHEKVVSSVTHTAATGFHDQHHQVQSHGSSSWTQNSTVLQASSPRSCITTSLSTHSMLDFSAKPRHKPADHNNYSEGNSTAETAPTLKKARVQGSSSPQSILKVRKEKLGDRITALHQLVSPFGKTDTASVLQEAIGYIRFLQSQIEALSSPYLQQQQKQRQAGRQQQYHQQQQRQRRKHHQGNKDEEEEEKEEEIKKDLKSRGLCLVPVSFTMHVGGDINGADFWASPLAGGF